MPLPTINLYAISLSSSVFTKVKIVANVCTSVKKSETKSRGSPAISAVIETITNKIGADLL